MKIFTGDDRPVYAKDFDLDKYTDQQCNEFFRFRSEDIRNLCNLLGFPAEMQAANGHSGCGTKASGMNICILF